MFLSGIFFLTQHFITKLHLYCCLQLQFIHFQYCVIFHHVKLYNSYSSEEGHCVVSRIIALFEQRYMHLLVPTNQSFSGNRIAGSLDMHTFNFARTFPSVFWAVVPALHSYQQRWERFCGFSSFTTLSMVRLLIFQQSSGCKVVSPRVFFFFF